MDLQLYKRNNNQGDSREFRYRIKTSLRRFNNYSYSLVTNAAKTCYVK